MPVAAQRALRVAIARDQGCHRRVGALDEQLEEIGVAVSSVK
jgi:hypothetical protein